MDLELCPRVIPGRGRKIGMREATFSAHSRESGNPEPRKGSRHLPLDPRFRGGERMRGAGGPNILRSFPRRRESRATQNPSRIAPVPRFRGGERMRGAGGPNILRSFPRRRKSRATQIPSRIPLDPRFRGGERMRGAGGPNILRSFPRRRKSRATQNPSRIAPVPRFRGGERNYCWARMGHQWRV